MARYIDADKLKKRFCGHCEERKTCKEDCYDIKIIDSVPSAQPNREYIEQIKWERDTAIQQLKELGYGLGEKIRTDVDTISRQQAIDALDKRFDSIPMEQTTEILLLRKDLRELPSAQPEIIRCKDAVSKADVLETYADLYDIFEDNAHIYKELHKIYDKLNALPSVQPEWKKGEWNTFFSDSYKVHKIGVECSLCGYRTQGRTNYCPNCGADMREVMK